MDENNFNNNQNNMNSNDTTGSYSAPDASNNPTSSYGSQQNYNYSSNSGSFNSPEPFSQPSYGYSIPPVEPEMGIKDWIIVLVVMLIPCLNIIMALVWAFSGNNKTRSNFCKAQLIVWAAVTILSILLSVVVGSAAAVFMQELMYYMY